VKKPASRTPSPPRSRRRFLGTLWLTLGAAIVVEYVILAGDLLRPRQRLPKSPDAGVVVAGPVTSFEPGSVTAFPVGKFYLARLEEGGFMALSRTCTHLGCTVPWDTESHTFVCPCHASSFDIRGCVVTPPAPRPLDLHPVRIENGVVKVDTGNRIRRDSFDPRHVTRT